MKFRDRLLLAFGGLIAIFVLFIGYNLYFLADTAYRIDTVVRTKYETETRIRKAYETVLSIHSDVWDAMLADPAGRKAEQDKLDAMAKDFYRTLDGIGEELPALYGQITELKLKFRSYYVFGMSILEMKDLREYIRRSDVDEKFRQNKLELAGLIEKTYTASRKDFDQSLKELQSSFKWMRGIIAFFALLSVISAFILSRMLSTRLTRPVDHLLDFAENITKGVYGVRIEAPMSGEWKRLADAFNQMTDQLNRVFEELNQEIDERKRVEEQLMELSRELEERVELSLSEIRQRDHIILLQSRLAAMGEMIGNIAHQWRQPLNAVGVMVQLIRIRQGNGSLDEAALTEKTDRIMEQIEHMSQTIDDFRNFFRADKEKSEFALNDAVRETVSLVDAAFRNSNIRIEFDSAVQIRTTGYPNEFKQALMNILTNAREAFADRQCENAAVFIRLVQECKKPVIVISDNAGGIHSSVIERMFDPYFTTKEMGNGIGLYMAKMIIEKNMGGRLSARNVEGGAEFRMEFSHIAQD